jgi:zinc metalloprotease ZmpB
VKADTIILQAQFSFAPDTSMPAAAQATVDTAEVLYDHATAMAVRQAFVDRGILP